MSSAALDRRILVQRLPAANRAASGMDRHARWIAIFLAVGVAVRLVRFLLRFPLWTDEALLAVNFLDRDFAGLMRPLECHQVAPLLFLWTELAAVKLFGFNEWALRLFPLLSGIGSLFLFRRLARRVVRGTALMTAVGIFSVAYSGIRYSCEAKPYGIDLLASTAILLLTVEWWRGPPGNRRLWLLTAFTPLALGFSFPAVFVAGGASLFVAAALLAAPSRRGWIDWIAYNVVLSASFLGWYWLTVRAQAQAELSVMATDWHAAFPPRDSLLHLIRWLLETHTGSLLAVPLGGDHGGSTATFLLCLAAVVALARQRRYRLLLLCAAPFALTFLAAALHRYPYGGHMRLAMHVVPIVSLLAGIGLAALRNAPFSAVGISLRTRLAPRAAENISPRACEFIKVAGTVPVPSAVFSCSGRHRDCACYFLSQPRSETRTVIDTTALACILLLLVPLGVMLHDFYQPAKDQKELRKRDFAAWFWPSLERGREVACLAASAPPGLPDLPPAAQGRASPQFLCDARIYSTRSGGPSCDLGRVSRQRPLACVHYWSHFAPYDATAFRHWLDAMRQHYVLVSRTDYPLLQDIDDDRQPEPGDDVEVYEFAPR